MLSICIGKAFSQCHTAIQAIHLPDRKHQAVISTVDRDDNNIKKIYDSDDQTTVLVTVFL